MMNPGKPRKRKVVRRVILIVLLLALAGGIGWFAYNSLKREYTTTYDTYTATTGSISNALSFSGNLSLIDSETYAASSSGTVKAVYVAAGDEVEEDQKLITSLKEEADDYQKKIAMLEARLSQADSRAQSQKEKS